MDPDASHLSEPSPVGAGASTLAWKATRYPFTLITCGFIAFAGLLSFTATGQTLTRRALHSFGSSPRDLLALDVWRVVVSAMITDGGIVFWIALVFTALFAGAAEHLVGTAITAFTFWGAHFASFAFTGLLTASLTIAGSRLGALLFVTRDVGPSAGYVGCLGLALVCSGWKYRWWLLGAIAIGLCAALVASLPELHTAPRDVTADLAHATALVFGAGVGLVVELRRVSA